MRTRCGARHASRPLQSTRSSARPSRRYTFAKVDVDHARDVSSRLGISAMPTFKVFEGGKEVAVQQGWPGEAKIKELLLNHGAKVAPEKPKEGVILCSAEQSGERGEDQLWCAWFGAGNFISAKCAL